MKHNRWTEYDASSRDAEKRWHDPETFQAAVRYVACTIALAAVAFAANAAWHPLLAAILVPAILFVGTVGAFIRTYQAWCNDGFWVIWQGAGWILVVLFMFCLGVPTAAM